MKIIHYSLSISIIFLLICCNKNKVEPTIQINETPKNYQIKKLSATFTVYQYPDFNKNGHISPEVVNIDFDFKYDASHNLVKISEVHRDDIHGVFQTIQTDFIYNEKNQLIKKTKSTKALKFTEYLNTYDKQTILEWDNNGEISKINNFKIGSSPNSKLIKIPCSNTTDFSTSVRLNNTAFATYIETTGNGCPEQSEGYLLTKAFLRNSFTDGPNLVAQENNTKFRTLGRNKETIFKETFKFSTAINPFYLLPKNAFPLHSFFIDSDYGALFLPYDLSSFEYNFLQILTEDEKYYSYDGLNKLEFLNYNQYLHRENERNNNNLIFTFAYDVNIKELQRISL